MLGLPRVWWKVRGSVGVSRIWVTTCGSAVDGSREFQIEVIPVRVLRQRNVAGREYGLVLAFRAGGVRGEGKRRGGEGERERRDVVNACTWSGWHLERHDTMKLPM